MNMGETAGDGAGEGGRAPARPYRMTARRAAVEATRDRICEATVDLWLEVPYDDMTLDEIADRAGVTRQTVLRHFESKDKLVLAAAAWFGPQIDALVEVDPGDVATAVDATVARYELMGDANVRMLEVEARFDEVHRLLELGRADHRAWLERTFADDLAAARAATRSTIVDALHAATDVTVWKLLRRDLERSQAATTAVMRRLVTGALADTAHRTPGGPS